MRRQWLLRFLTGLTSLLVSQPVLLQTISFSAPFDLPDSIRRYSIIGQNNDKQLIILSVTPGGDPKLLFYDYQLQSQQNRYFPDLKNSRLHFMIPQNNRTDLVYEKFEDGIRIYKMLSIQKDTVTENEILKLETGIDTYWRFISSPSKNGFLLYNLDENFTDSVKLTFLHFSRNYEVTTIKQMSFRVDLQFDKPGQVFLDDDANIYTMIYDQPDNYRLGTNLKIYKYETATSKLARKEFYLKEKKPVDIRLAFHPESKLISVHSFYHDFYTKNINGIVCATLNEKLDTIVPFTFFEFDKKFKNRLNTPQSRVSSSRLMNYLKIYNSSFSDSGETFVQAIMDTRYLSDSLMGMPEPVRKNNRSVMETDPMLGVMQREAMMRSAMQTGGRGRGRSGSSLASGSMGSTNSEAYITVMNQRPDLFFVPRDTSDVFRSSQVYLKKGIYDRQLVFGFSGKGMLKWKQWYETEDQSFFRRNSLYAAETDSCFVSVFYRHNYNGKTELALTRVSKRDGTIQDIPLQVPRHITLLTTQNFHQLGPDKIVLLYLNNRTNQTGLAKVEW
jgi:hypothetical protein